MASHDRIQETVLLLPRHQVDQAHLDEQIADAAKEHRIIAIGVETREEMEQCLADDAMHRIMNRAHEILAQTLLVILAKEGQTHSQINDHFPNARLLTPTGEWREVRVHHARSEKVGHDRALRLLQEMDHPNVGRLHGFGRLHGRMLQVLEKLGDVKTLEEAQLQLPIEEFFRSLDEMLSGVIAVHQHGVVHRDIKPANALLGTRNGMRTVRLVDFDTAVPLRERTKEEITGTATFMPPEADAHVEQHHEPRYTQAYDAFSVGQAITAMVAPLQ